MIRLLIVFLVLLAASHAHLTITTHGHQTTLPLGPVLIFALALLVTAGLSRAGKALRHAW